MNAGAVRAGLSGGAIVGLLTGCAGIIQPQSGMPLSGPAQRVLHPPEQQRTAAAFKTLYSFNEPPDGATPYAPLAYMGGYFYGTTLYGGTYNQGTVFSVSRTGKERVLHSFGASGDGLQPYGGVIAVNGTLYGTTRIGGRRGSGAIFSITPSGEEKIFYSFENLDGSEPIGPPLFFKGALYGTTLYGGKYGWGTVYKVRFTGWEHVLYSFMYYRSDGGLPESGLVYFKGAFYGTTDKGGSQNCGTVFKVDRAGHETVIHNFGGINYADGQYPFSGLTVIGGELFGTVPEGGSGDGGILYKVTTDGQETILHNFGFNKGGDEPYGTVIAVNGTIYGTTAYGGGSGDGTVFSMTSSGSEQIIYSFGTQSPGTVPYAGLINVGGTLYGSTTAGGAANGGTIFRLRL